MKKMLFAAALITIATSASASEINVDFGKVRIQAPGVTVTFGSRNDRGYYWDGDEYRSPDYWQRHNGPKGEKYYTGRGNNGVPHQGGGHCPPGQAKKGNC